MRYLVIILSASLAIACNNKSDKKENTTDSSGMDKKVSISDTNENGMDVDTSIAGIFILDSSSFAAVAGPNNSFCSGETYCFRSVKNGELLKATAHPGNNAYEISEFEVRWLHEEDKSYPELNVDHFVTGKGIKLGMTKQEIVQLFGTGYKAEDSTTNFIRLSYRITEPSDTRTWLLRRYNMPIYYATYEFIKDKLQQFKFGLEYP
jgi:hypothetical protein